MLKRSLKENVSAVTVATWQVEWALDWLELALSKDEIKDIIKNGKGGMPGTRYY